MFYLLPLIILGNILRPRTIISHGRCRMSRDLILVTWRFYASSTDLPAHTHRELGQHDDVIKWKHFPRYCPFMRGIHRSPVNSPHKGQWRGALMFSLIRAWTDSWANNGDAGDLRCYRDHYDVIVVIKEHSTPDHNQSWLITRKFIQLF